MPGGSLTVRGDTSDLVQVQEVFNGNLNRLARLASMDVELVEFLFYTLQYASFEILFTTVRALETGNVIHNEKLPIVPVNVLSLARLKFPVTTKRTPCLHHAPLW